MKQLKNFNDDTFRFKDYLRNKILENSESQDYDKATKEWDITGCCLAQNKAPGKKYFLYKIVNEKTGSVLFPLEAPTIRSFNQEYTTDAITIFETLYDLKQKATANEEPKLEDFNKKTLDYLYHTAKLFEDNEYNGYDKSKDYSFLYQMLSGEKEPTLQQERKFKALYYKYIKPYLDTLKSLENIPIIEEKNINNEEY